MLESVLVKMATQDQAVVNVTLTTTEIPVMDSVKVKHTCSVAIAFSKAHTHTHTAQNHAVKELRAVLVEIVFVTLATQD